ncbi:MAG: EamA family transporter [Kiloniellaceae bacterium]|nr:EamA family transporter [Kiloniellaceae bacterium]
MTPRAWPAILAAVAVGVQVGAATVASRAVVAEVGPATLALLRYAIGACCLLPFFLAAPRVRFQGRDLAAVAALGIGQFGILVALLNFGLLQVTSARAALLFATFPLMTMLLAAALGRERLTVAKTLGVALSFAGVGLALLDKLAIEAAAEGAWVGVAAVLGSALTGAVCSVLYRPYLQKYPTLPVSTLAMIASVFFLTLLAVPEGALETVPRLGPGAWAAILFIGVSSGIAYFGWLWALGRLPPTQVTVFLSLSPVTAALLGALLLGETLSPLTLAGLVAVVAGLVVAFARPRGSRTSGGRAPGSRDRAGRSGARDSAPRGG